ncbi:MAG: hypothetical protein ACKOX6_09290 [Bdellovibrio sp.]
MRNILLSLLIFAVSSSVQAFDCSQLPHQGPVAIEFMLADGTAVVFTAKMTIAKIVTSFDEHKTTHTYSNPQVFIANKEIALSEDALSYIAQALGYDFVGFRDMQTNAGYFRKKQVLTSNGESLMVKKAPRTSEVVSPKGSVKFFQADCADWAFN